VNCDLELRIPNDLAAMARLADAVARFVAAHQLSDAVANALNVCVDEAVSNAINHGYAAGARGEIAVRLARRADRVVLEIEDDGAPFDPLQAPEPDLSLPLAERPIGGLGVHLMRNLMDEVAYARVGDKNLLKLVKNVATT
jgi:anti-sigma regulatory factor (Ser/Thr protein kinase)